MGQIRHGCVTTTHAIRATIQRSQVSNAELSRELGINVKTVAKWRKRQTVEDKKTGPRAAAQPFCHRRASKRLHWYSGSAQQYTKCGLVARGSWL